MLPIAHISPTSVRKPMILTRTCVPCSMTISALLVNCAGVALASYWISSGINCEVRQRLGSPSMDHAGGIHTWEEMKRRSGPAWAKKP